MSFCYCSAVNTLAVGSCKEISADLFFEPAEICAFNTFVKALVF